MGHDFVDDRIAVVGIAGRFPGAASVEELWRRLLDGAELIQRFSPEESRAAGATKAQLDDPAFVPAAAPLAESLAFDAEFFEFSSWEAGLTDPQQRLFLEAAWEALESAGQTPERFGGAIGVYGGCSTNTYWDTYADADGGGIDPFQSVIANDKDFLTTRVAYKLGLTGPAVTVQTACSTSLVAVHLGCEALLSGQCDLVLAGGASVLFPAEAGYIHQDGGISSEDGHCRPFDAAASGTVRGSGVGVVALRRLRDALEDGDPIRGVICGSAINNDGSDKVGFTAPSVQGQAEVIRSALEVSGVSADAIGMVEAHGTATKLGDPIEFAALTQVYREQTDRVGYCAIGSVKSNLGHLDAASGITGLIKALLAVERGAIPATLHFGSPNPELQLEQSPFFVNAELRPWDSADGPRRAAVSSFGIGGTNAHVVLEQAPQRRLESGQPGFAAFPISARTGAGLAQTARDLAAHLSANPSLAPGEVANTLQHGRREFPLRAAFACREIEELVAQLERSADGLAGARKVDSLRPLVFMFPGQGAQRPGMAAALYGSEPEFRVVLDRCLEQLEPEVDANLRELLTLTNGDQLTDLMNETAVAQPALFAIEYALAQLWIGRGASCALMMGHSIGEYTAACVADVLSLEDACRLVAARGRLMQEAERGQMLAVLLPEQEVTARITGRPLSLAAVNGPQACVVSGRREAVDALRRELDVEGVRSTVLRTSHAFHSELVEPIMEGFAEVVASCRLAPPTLPWISNLTGRRISEAEATDPGYWVRHLRATVRFYDSGLRDLLEGPAPLLLELGPGKVLSTLVAAAEPSATVIPVLDDPANGERSLAEAQARVWAAGGPRTWSPAEGARKAMLPTYPFERREHVLAKSASQPSPPESPPRLPHVDSGLLRVSWHREAPLDALAGGPSSGRCMLFSDGSPLAAAVLAELATRSIEAVVVRAGERFATDGSGEYSIDPAAPEHYRQLAEALAGTRPCDYVVHLWSLETAAGSGPTDRQALGFESLLSVARELLDGAVAAAASVVTASANAREVVGGDLTEPSGATLLGACRALPSEYDGLVCRHVDLERQELETGPAALGRAFVNELVEGSSAALAYRGGYRWTEAIEPWGRPLDPGPGSWVRPGGAYVISGGLGGIGLAIAERLGDLGAGSLALLSRRRFPPPSEWPAIAASELAEAALAARLLVLREKGVEVHCVTADVADEKQLPAAVAEIHRLMPRPAGLFHAAGIPPQGLASFIELRDMREAMAPKLRGAELITSAFAGSELDFVVLCSSLSAIKPGPGGVDYCAANSFLDAFAISTASSGTRILSVGWGRWRVGMAAGVSLPSDLQARWDAEAEDALTEEEGLALLDEAMAALPRGGHLIAVSGRTALSLETPVRRSGASSDVSSAADDEGRTSPRRGRTEITETVKAVWAEHLGIDSIETDADFFELGGHSWLAVQVNGRIGELLGVRLPLREFLAAPTINGVAEAFLARSAEPEAAGSERGPG